MIIAVVGSGGKTTLIKKMASDFCRDGKTVLVTTTTHMAIEDHTLLSDDADTILAKIKENGYVMTGVQDGGKIKALSKETFDAQIFLDKALYFSRRERFIPVLLILLIWDE